MKTVSASLAVLLAMCATLAHGQTFRPKSKSRADGSATCRPVLVPVYGSPYDVPYGRCCLPPVAGYLRASAMMLRAQADCAFLTSRARIYAAEARRLEIDNKQNRIKAYFEMKRINKEYRAAQHKRRASKPAAVHQTKVDTGRPVSSAASLPAVTEIAWPAVLQEGNHAPYRRVVERVLAKRKGCGEIQGTDREELTQATQFLLAELKDHIREATPREYIITKRLLERLSFEARLAL